MEIEITSTAEEDLKKLESEQKERVISKLEEIEKKISQGFGIEKVVEKRLNGNWDPILQQRVGKLRCWLIEGEKVGRPEDKTFLLRVLEKEEQLELRGVEINPEVYL